MKILRFFLVVFGSGVALTAAALPSNSEIPENNPVANYDLSWTDDFQWKSPLSINDVQGESIDEKFDNAQKILVKRGGGVVYFPSGKYYFKENLLLEKGIVVRGTEPVNSEKYNPIVVDEYPKAFIDAREPRYTLGTYFVFPTYNPSFKGSGTDVHSAFKGIRLKDPKNGEFCGVVNVNIHNGHIALGEKEILKKNYKTGNKKGHMLVFGCILTNAALPIKSIPASFQKGWQRWTDVDFGAITVYACKNILIANNRIPEYDQDNFLMKDYKLYPNQKDWSEKKNLTQHDIWFDYQNRTGIRVNFLPMLHQLSIWKIYDELNEAVKKGTYEDYVTPGTLAKGIVIRNNYIFTTGHGGIKTTGDGAIIAYNMIQCKHSVVLPTANGLYMDAHVNDVRGIEVRGWRWTIEGNDYDVHANYTPDGIKYNDGEGLMHESWENVGVRDSKIINNVGNRYICFWRVPVRGLEIRGNRIRIKPNWHSIFVNSQSRFSPTDLVDLPCENLVIKNNTTQGGGIKVLGENGEGNVIINNVHTLLNEGKIEQRANCQLINNQNYFIVN